MKHWYVSWNENIAYEAEFYTDAEEGSPEWWDLLHDNREWCDSNGMDNVNVETIEDQYERKSKPNYNECDVSYR